MPESSNIEIAHRVHEGGEKQAHHRRHQVAIEVGEAFLLALVAIATAWSGYQSALWDGRSAELYGTSSRIRIQATQNTTRAGQEQLYDATTFNFWLQARLTGDAQLARDYEKRYRVEYRPAFRAWLATNPFVNPRAPPGPILMPQYHNALLERGAELNTRASDVFEEGAHARETGDKYVRTTVLLATVLFLIALSQRFGVFRLRVGLLCVALVLLGIAVTSIGTYPRL
ncbi:MAG: hypothetical protein ACJ755_04155 [Gaiellaceae bacterium]